MKQKRRFLEGLIANEPNLRHRHCLILCRDLCALLVNSSTSMPRVEPIFFFPNIVFPENERTLVWPTVRRSVLSFDHILVGAWMTNGVPIETSNCRIISCLLSFPSPLVQELG